MEPRPFCMLGQTFLLSHIPALTPGPELQFFLQLPLSTHMPNVARAYELHGSQRVLSCVLG